MTLPGPFRKSFWIEVPVKKFVSADAKIDGNTVVLSSPQVAAPVAARYYWDNLTQANLYNKEGLPAFLTIILIPLTFSITQGILWGFISHGLYKKEKKYAVPFVVLCSGLFMAGGAFGYFIAFPYALEFLLGLGGKNGAWAFANLGVLIALALGFVVTFAFSRAAVRASRSVRSRSSSRSCSVMSAGGDTSFTPSTRLTHPPSGVIFDGTPLHTHSTTHIRVQLALCFQPCHSYPPS